MKHIKTHTRRTLTHTYVHHIQEACVLNLQPEQLMSK